MPGSSFGQALRITTAGESHGPAELVIVDGCPQGLPLSEADLLPDLLRRRPGQSGIVSGRAESDQPQILSGVFEGLTTGTPIAILIPNQEVRSQDYAGLAGRYRPGHADHSYDQKYGHRDPRGGGRASARETVARVAAGAIAKKILHTALGSQVIAYVERIGDVTASIPTPEHVSLADVEHFRDGTPNMVRCPDHDAARRMITLVEAMRDAGDSVGGVAVVVAHPVPAGLGEPVFDKLKADLGKALLSLPAVVGVEYGAGFALAGMRGSEANDRFVPGLDKIRTESNRHGGILGGISSGMPIVLRAALKPASSIRRPQETVTTSGEPTTLEVAGRHDPCVLPRFVPIAEAMVALVLADHWIRHVGQSRALAAGRE